MAYLAYGVVDVVGVEDDGGDEADEHTDDRESQEDLAHEAPPHGEEHPSHAELPVRHRRRHHAAAHLPPAGCVLGPAVDGAPLCRLPVTGPWHSCCSWEAQSPGQAPPTPALLGRGTTYRSGGAPTAQEGHFPLSRGTYRSWKHLPLVTLAISRLKPSCSRR